MTSTTPLAADLLPSVHHIAIELFGQADSSTIRRVRHLIQYHDLPHTKKGGRIESRRSWLHAYYARPDRNGR